MTVDYFLQYQVVTRNLQGDPLEVAFHGPGKKGFHSAEQAQTIIEHLQACDLKIGKHSPVYEIIPVAVANDFEKYSAIDMTMDSDDLQDIISQAMEPEPDAPKGKSN